MERRLSSMRGKCSPSEVWFLISATQWIHLLLPKELVNLKHNGITRGKPLGGNSVHIGGIRKELKVFRQELLGIKEITAESGGSKYYYEELERN